MLLAKGPHWGGIRLLEAACYIVFYSIIFYFRLFHVDLRGFGSEGLSTLASGSPGGEAVGAALPQGSNMAKDRVSKVLSFGNLSYLLWFWLDILYLGIWTRRGCVSSSI